MDIASVSVNAADAGSAALDPYAFLKQNRSPDFETFLAAAASEKQAGLEKAQATSETAATAESAQTEEEADAAEAAAKRQASLEYLAKWIASGGAPEELERDRIVTMEDLDKDGDGVPDILQHTPANALETMSSTIADPEDEGKVHVVVTKIDAEGKPKITRTITMDNGDGQDRSELTAERAQAKNKDGRPEAASASAGSDKSERTDEEKADA